MAIDFSNPLILLAIMSLLAVLPFAILGLTCFVKFHVVFGLLRIAIGAQQVPSAMITSLLSLLLSLFVMSSVLSEMKEKAGPLIMSMTKKKSPLTARQTIEFVESLSEKLQEPLRRFLEQHSQARERRYFSELAAAEGGSGGGFVPLAAAFVLSELRSAFVFGFLLFLPFLVIDLVVANLLVGMGMTMVSPATIALPLKLLLFVCTDSWFLLARSLLQSYR